MLLSSLILAPARVERFKQSLVRGSLDVSLTSATIRSTRILSVPLDWIEHSKLEAGLDDPLPLTTFNRVG